MKTKDISIDRFVKILNSSFETFDKTNKEDLKTALETQKTKNKLRLGERERLIKKYGNDHPRVKVAEARISIFNQLIKYTKLMANIKGLNELEPSKNLWIVHGYITDTKGNGLKGLKVSLYDKDLLFDDQLGTTSTDQDGYFKISYKKEKFNELYEKNPDIYLKVFNSRGKLLYNTIKAVRMEAGRIEEYIIKLKSSVLKL